MLHDASGAWTTVSAWRDAGRSMVYTQGVFDLLHVGHQIYLKGAAELGEKLIVGVDSDQKARLRKGHGRPAQDFETRALQLISVGGIDLIVKKDAGKPKWHYVELVMPDVLVASEGCYSAVEIEQLKNRFDLTVVELPRFQGISTSTLVAKS